MMQVIKYPDESEKLDSILNKRNFKFELEVEKKVEEIIRNVEKEGDAALYRYTEKFDGAKLDSLCVSEEEFNSAYKLIEEGFLDILKKASDNIESFHQKQLEKNWFTVDEGNILGQLINPLKRVGAYIPGGRAAYPSSVLMNVIPAKVAGVKEIVAVTPADENGKINPHNLVALKESGVEEVYKIGGAQAVAALAMGTETIKAVNKIVGPGNIYVTIAKKKVYGYVDIDMLAGPSEILILADENAEMDYIVSDLLSQAEHDPRAIVSLITTSKKHIEMIPEILDEKEKNNSAKLAIKNNALIIEVPSIKEGISLANRFAPEHLELLINDPFAELGGIKNAGAIFIGKYSPEPLGDYMAGPNHVLPTGGTAVFSSPLTVDEFIKKSSIIYYQKDNLNKIKDDIISFAKIEGLNAHAEAIASRFKENK